mgnify:FL=1
MEKYQGVAITDGVNRKNHILPLNVIIKAYRDTWNTVIPMNLGHTSSVLVELAKVLHTTPNYLLLGDVEADDWMDDMIQMLEKIKRPEHRELAKKQIALLVQLGDS